MNSIFTRYFLGLLLLVGLSGPIARAEASEARTCVASLFLQDEINEKLAKDARSWLKKFGHDPDAGYFVIKANGLKGIIECLEGDYEDVTLFSHSAEMISPVLFYQKKTVIDGKDQIAIERVPSEIFRSFVEGRRTINPKIRQVTLINCDTEELLRTDHALRQLIDYNGLNVRSQPHDPLASWLMLSSKKFRTESLFGLIVAENAQPETAKKLFCLVASSMQLVGESAAANCVRGRYSANVWSLGLGFKHSNKLIRFKTADLPEEGSALTSSSLIDLEIAFRGDLNLDFNSLEVAVKNTQSYGFSVGLFESWSVTNIERCFRSSSPEVRLACFGRIQALREIFEETDKDLSSFQDENGLTPWHAAVIRGDRYAVKKLRRLDPNVKNAAGETPLLLAAKLRRGEFMRGLIHEVRRKRLRIDLDVQDPATGNTALIEVVSRLEPGEGTMLGLSKDLILRKADITIRNHAGHTVKDIVKTFRYDHDLRRMLRIWPYH